MSKNPTSYQALLRLEKYDHFYINPKSGKITFRKTVKGETIKIATGVVGKLNPKTGVVEGITKARDLVEIELEKRRTGKSETQVRRERKGVTNPYLGDLYFEEFLPVKTVGKSKSTITNYNKLWNHGLRGFWGVPPADKKRVERDLNNFPHTIPVSPFKTCNDLTTKNVELFKVWYLKHQPKRQFEKTYDCFATFVRFLFERKFITALPDLSKLHDLDEMVKKNKRYKKAGRVFSKDEQTRLLNAWKLFPTESGNGSFSLHKRILQSRARCGVTLGLRCGMRSDEIRSLKVQSINFKKSVISVWSTKNNEWREIPMMADVAEAIREQMSANILKSSDWLFPMPSDRETYVSQQVFEKAWYKVRELAGVIPQRKYDARFHDLRKTFATMTAEQGWPIKVACEILDMSVKVYTETYVDHISIERKTELMRLHFGGQS